MEFNLSELKELAKGRGLDLADDLLEKGAKELAGLVLDMIEKAVKDSENKWDDAVALAVMPKLRDLASKIEVKL